MDKNQEKYLLSICTALGGHEEKNIDPDDPEAGTTLVYIPGDEVSECLKDLKRILRKDDMTPDRQAFLTLGKWEVLQKHLIPILLITNVETNMKLVTAIVELFVPMTWPVDEKSPEIVNHSHVLRRYKEAFMSEKIIAQPHKDRNSSDEARIRIILFLFRNLLAIRDAPRGAIFRQQKHTRNPCSSGVEKSNIIQLIITIAGSLKEREFADWKAIILEIVYYIFRDRSPADVFERSESELARLMKDERVHKVGPQVSSSRHSRFGGTLSIELGNGRVANLHQQTSKAVHSIGNSLDLGKKDGRSVKMKADVMKQTITTRPRSIVSPEAFENCFAAVVDSIKKDIDMERNTVSEEHHVQLLKIITFFLEYQALKIMNKDKSGRFGFDTVSDILNVRGVAFILRRIGTYDAEKKTKTFDLQIAVDCFKQLLVSLDLMAQSESEEWREASDNIQNNLYYEHSTTELIIKLCKNFKGPNNPYLKSLIETIHILLQMLKGYSKEKKTMLVRKKKKARKAKPKKTGNDVDDGAVVQDVLSEDEEQLPTAEYIEHEFRFEKIETEFASENVVDTYCELLSQYETLEDKYFQMIVVMFHRIFVKLDMQAFFYRLSVLELFSRVTKFRGSSTQCPGYEKIVPFISFLMKQFAKRAADNPMIYVELMFPKTRADCIRLQSNRPYEVIENSAKAQMARKYDYEVNTSLSWKEKVDKALSYLVVRQKSVMEWLMITLSEVAAFRENRTFVEKQDLEEKIISERQRRAIKKSRHLQILFRLFKFEEDKINPDEVKWFIPEGLNSDELLENSNIIKFALPTKENARKVSEETVEDSDDEDVGKESDVSSEGEGRGKGQQLSNDWDFDDDLMDAALQRHQEEALAKSVSHLEALEWN
ncbi:timeless protein-domain-containing protein [Chytridium lagenaria]|nr:timeless protein-domain-containing protein [Chytridium lagenaria]